LETSIVELRILFDDPFWIGLFERTSDGRYEVSRYVFGSEPKDQEIYNLILKNYYSLRFSVPLEFESNNRKALAFKKRQKRARKELENITTGTKAQQAIKLQYEVNKLERKQRSREQREAIKKRKYELKQQKKKKKKKGH